VAVTGNRIHDVSQPAGDRAEQTAHSPTAVASQQRSGPDGEPPELLSPHAVSWLLACQQQRRHPATGAPAGGWGWTDLSGAVPDADDTAAALLAIGHLQTAGQTASLPEGQWERAVQRGITWLLNLQNRDGGWPTFCRGWGKLPFDRSGPDLTAHALRALGRWQPAAGSAANRRRMEGAASRGWRYLERTQRPDGSWLPLWFGNQDQPGEENPVYGTARVLSAYFQLDRGETKAARRGCQWLESVQNPDGGWSGGQRCGSKISDAEGGALCASSVEETALALEALLAAELRSRGEPTIERGLSWLTTAISENRHGESAPIGFYFAKLWYYERLYPLTFTVAALGSAISRRTRSAPDLARQDDSTNCGGEAPDK